MLKQDYYNDIFELAQQKINFSFLELCLPDDSPVYTLKKQWKIGLPACDSDKGRIGYEPIMMYAFIRLTKGQKSRREVFYDFKGKELTGEVPDELNCN